MRCLESSTISCIYLLRYSNFSWALVILNSPYEYKHLFIFIDVRYNWTGISTFFSPHRPSSIADEIIYQGPEQSCVKRSQPKLSLNSRAFSVHSPSPSNGHLNIFISTWKHTTHHRLDNQQFTGHWKQITFLPLAYPYSPPGWHTFHSMYHSIRWRDHIRHWLSSPYALPHSMHNHGRRNYQNALCSHAVRIHGITKQWIKLYLGKLLSYTHHCCNIHQEMARNIKCSPQIFSHFSRCALVSI